jgi:hypothetical protein
MDLISQRQTLDIASGQIFFSLGGCWTPENAARYEQRTLFEATLSDTSG